MNLGQGWKTVLTLFACNVSRSTDSKLPHTHIYPALMTFYVQTWEEYHTHTLTLGVISGPVEGILTLCIVYAITAFLGGGSFWQRSLLESVGVHNYNIIPDSIYNLAWNEWYMVYGGIVLVFNTISR